MNTALCIGANLSRLFISTARIGSVLFSIFARNTIAGLWGADSRAIPASVLGHVDLGSAGIHYAIAAVALCFQALIIAALVVQYRRRCAVEQRALREGNYLRLIADSCSSVIFYVRMPGEKMDYISRLYVEWFKRPPPLAKTLAEALGESLYGQLLGPLQEVSKTKRQEIEAEVTTPDGEHRFFKVLLLADRDANAQVIGVCGVLYDTTREHEADSWATELQLELARASRLASLGELAGSFAHELSQPLTSILANAEVARRMVDRGRAKPEEIREILTEIIEEDERAGEILRGLRGLIQKRGPQMVETHLNEVVIEVVHLARSQSPFRDYELEIQLGENLPHVLGDKVQLQQVLINLLLNASHALEAVPRRERKVGVITVMGPEGHVCMTVYDNGPGMPEEVLKRLFEPFFSTRESGLGLGLTLCRRIAQAHCGQLLGGNRVEGGAAFTLQLPPHASSI